MPDAVLYHTRLPIPIHRAVQPGREQGLRPEVQPSLGLLDVSHRMANISLAWRAVDGRHLPSHDLTQQAHHLVRAGLTAAADMED